MPADSCQLGAMTSCPCSRAARTVVKIDGREGEGEGRERSPCVRATIPNRLVASNGAARSKQNISLQLSVALYLALSLDTSCYCFIKFMPKTRSTRATLTNCIKNARDELKIRAMNSLCVSVKGERERWRAR